MTVIAIRCARSGAAMAAKIGEFAERFAGSSDIFRHDGRKPTAGINFSPRTTA